jgi:molecular chaperone GrpE
VTPEGEKDPQLRVVDRRWWARGDSATPDESGDKTRPTDSRKPTYIEELEQRLADLAAQLQSITAGHRRSLEEFEEVKARMRREAAREVERGRRAVLAELLDVVDNLDRAIAASHEPAGSSASGTVDSLARGVELVRDQFLAKLETFGVSRVPALGRPFDALRHEAVTAAPVEHPAQDGIVLAVVKEGYAIGDEVLRPASVVVGQHAGQA